MLGCWMNATLVLFDQREFDSWVEHLAAWVYVGHLNWAFVFLQRSLPAVELGTFVLLFRAGFSPRPFIFQSPQVGAFNVGAPSLPFRLVTVATSPSTL